MRPIARAPERAARSARPATGLRSPLGGARLVDLQRAAGNRDVTALVQRDKALNPMDPRNFASYGAWLATLPSGAVDETSVDVTEKVRKELPDLASLVVELKADCADVTILLKHHYYEAHGRTIKIRAQTDTKPRRRISFEIGAGVTRTKLRNALVNLGTVHFQDMRKADKLITYYGGPKRLKNLAEIMKAGLAPGDVLVWKKLAAIKGNFSGHIQTVQTILLSSPDFRRWTIEVLQGTWMAARPWARSSRSS